MASISPSPDSPSAAISPASLINSRPPSGSSPPPVTSSAPPPQSSPPPVTSSAPPPQSSPPPSTSSDPPPQSSPPLPIISPPPPPLETSPPPAAPPSPTILPSSPPPPTTLPPSPLPPSPQVSPPPSSPAAPPPNANSSPPPAWPPLPSTLPPPPPSSGSPPRTPVAPTIPPSPPPAVPRSPPPPQAANSSPPVTAPASPPPPPPVGLPPKHSPAPLVPPPLPPDSPSTPSSTSPPPASPASPPVPPLGSPPPSITSISPSVSPPIPSISPSANLVPSPPMISTSSNSSSPRPTNKPSTTSTRLSPNITADSTSSTTSAGLKAGGVAAIISGTMGFLVLTLVILAVWRIHVRKKRKDRSSLNSATPSPFASSQNSDSIFLRSQYPVQAIRNAGTNNYIHSQDGTMGSSRSWFTYQDLLGATGGFSADNLLGEGGFGCVYKGVLADGRVVAVKQLKAGSGQGEREFRAEVEIISRIHHRHLVSLVGYCISENQRLLVYDYVPNNTLHFHLHAEGKPAMDWASRVKVAAGAARGLAYLHEDCQPRIIHRDIKSTNILLDNNFDARVADFGLAKLALELELHTHVSTRVMGTFGYLAPEYASTGKLTEKSDVFSFGVVLLELITGHKPVDPSLPLDDESLVEWARPLLSQALEKEDFSDLVDPRLENNFTAGEMFRMIEAAAACVRHLASLRPKMSQVVRALDSMDELADLNNGVKPGQSGIFSSREQSVQIRAFQRMAFGSQDYGSDIYNSQSSWGS